MSWLPTYHRQKPFLDPYVSGRANFAGHSVFHKGAWHRPKLRGAGGVAEDSLEDARAFCRRRKTQIYKLQNTKQKLIKWLEPSRLQVVSEALRWESIWARFCHGLWEGERSSLKHKKICFFKMRVLCERQYSPNGRQLHWLGVLLCEPSINPYSVIMCGQAC